MPAFIRQPSFAAGELSPLLWGRTDIAAYARGLRRCFNFFISKQGSAFSRPGTLYVNKVKTSGGADAGRVRLIPFVYSDTESYVLEFGAGYIRFHSFGGTQLKHLLDYDGQTLNFTVGRVVKGVTSGALGTIIADTDAGATGTLQLGVLSGAFQNNETLIELFVEGATLYFDTQTANFTVGQVVTGSTSGAFGTLSAQADAGATGSLTLVAVTGVFLDNELITDPLGGSALVNGTKAVVNGTLYSGTAYEVATGYAVTDLPQLQWAQTGDILTLTHPNHEPKELRRYSADSWVFVPVSFSSPPAFFSDPDNPASSTMKPYLVRNVRLYFVSLAFGTNFTPGQVCTGATSGAGGVIKAQVLSSTTATSGYLELGESAGVYADGEVITDGLGGSAIVNGEPILSNATSQAHPGRKWKWKASVLGQHVVTGRIVETLPADVDRQYSGFGDPASGIPINSDMLAVYPDRPAVLRRAPTAGLLSRPTDWNSYRAIGFNYYRGQGALFGFIGTTDGRDFTDVGDEPDYSIQPRLATNPFEVRTYLGAVTRTDRPSAVAFFQERRVFGGGWSGGLAYRPGTLFFSATGDYGNFDLRTFVHVASEALVYELAARRREEIRSMLSLSSLVVFTNASIWTFGGAGGGPLGPESVDAKIVEEVGANYLPPLVVGGTALYCRTKGVGVRGLSFAYERGGISGTDLSSFSSHLFEGTSGELVDWTYAEDPWGLVWAVRADGSLLSFTYSGESQAAAWTQHATDGTIENVCAVPEINEDAVYLVVRRTVNGSAVRYIERMTSRVTRGDLSDDICIDCGIAYVGSPALSITGLGHLEGKSVYVIGKDNPVFGPFTVASGAITLTELPTPNNGSSVVLYVGLLYTPELETLDLAQADVRTKQKTVSKVAVEVVGTRGLWAGPSFDQLTQARTRDVLDGYGPIGAATGLIVVPVRSGWSTAARACIRQTQPIPVTVTAVVREVEVGG